MKDKTREKELDKLKAGIAGLREEIASLEAGMGKFAETKWAGTHAEERRDAARPEGPAHAGNGRYESTDFQNTLDEARAQGEKVVKELAAEIERHPLMGGIAAFGLGFIIAKRWYGGRNQ